MARISLLIVSVLATVLANTDTWLVAAQPISGEHIEQTAPNQFVYRAYGARTLTFSVPEEHNDVSAEASGCDGDIACAQDSAVIPTAREDLHMAVAGEQDEDLMPALEIFGDASQNSAHTASLTADLMDETSGESSGDQLEGEPSDMWNQSPVDLEEEDEDDDEDDFDDDDDDEEEDDDDDMDDMDDDDLHLPSSPSAMLQGARHTSSDIAAEMLNAGVEPQLSSDVVADQMTADLPSEVVAGSAEKEISDVEMSAKITASAPVVIDPAEISSDVLPAEMPADVLTAEISSDVLPAEISSDVLPAEISSDVLPAEISSDVIPAEIASDVLPAKISSDVLPAEMPADVVPAEMTSDVVLAQDGNVKEEIGTTSPMEDHQETLVHNEQEKSGLDVFEGLL